MTDLRKLDLQGNELTGLTVCCIGPPEIMQHGFYLGTLPSQLGYLKELQYFDLDTNSISGLWYLLY